MQSQTHGPQTTLPSRSLLQQQPSYLQPTSVSSAQKKERDLGSEETGYDVIRGEKKVCHVQCVHVRVRVNAQYTVALPKILRSILIIYGATHGRGCGGDTAEKAPDRQTKSCSPGTSTASGVIKPTFTEAWMRMSGLGASLWMTGCVASL